MVRPQFLYFNLIRKRVFGFQPTRANQEIQAEYSIKLELCEDDDVEESAALLGRE